jgi:hypothetical protein
VTESLSGNISAATNDSIFLRIKELVSGFMDGVLTLVGIKAQEVQTDKLCIGTTCVTENQLRNLLQSVNETPSEPNTEPTEDTGTGTLSPDTDNDTPSNPDNEGSNPDSENTEDTTTIPEPETTIPDIITSDPTTTPEPEVSPESEISTDTTIAVP